MSSVSPTRAAFRPGKAFPAPSLPAVVGLLLAVTPWACSGGTSTPREPEPDAAVGSTTEDAGGCPSSEGEEGQVRFSPISLTVPGFEATAELRGPGLAAPVRLLPGAEARVPAGPGYEASAARVVIPPAAPDLVGTAYQAALGAFDGCIRAGEIVTITASYTLEPGSGRLWASLTGAPDQVRIGALDGDALLASGDVTLAARQVRGLTNPAAVVLDQFGNLWVADSGIPEKVAMFRMASLGDLEVDAPDVVLSGPALASPRGLAFASDGALWVSNLPEDTIVRIAAEDLGASGEPTPSVTITSDDLAGAEAIAFDADGGLWVACQDGDSVVGFDSARLAADYDGPADVVLTAARLNEGGSVAEEYRSPRSLAFDADGNLWVGFWSGNDIVRFSTTDLTRSGRIDNPIAKTSGVTALVTGLAFDAAGGLWYPASANRLARLPPAALSSTGETEPDIVLESPALGSAVKLLMNPAPSGLPLH